MKPCTSIFLPLHKSSRITVSSHTHLSTTASLPHILPHSPSLIPSSTSSTTSPQLSSLFTSSCSHRTLVPLSSGHHFLNEAHKYLQHRHTVYINTILKMPQHWASKGEFYTGVFVLCNFIEPVTFLRCVVYTYCIA